ncbi:MAG TPA: Ig-like domain repeat protein [Gemmataceae bacterium]|nr:Ig-like domain repeat protein [Gemmataceae bacterium]
MQIGLPRWLRRERNYQPQRRSLRPILEDLEDRCLLAAPVVDPINFTPLNIPAGKTLFVPVTATDADGNPLTYTATSSNSQITVTPRNNPHPYLKISVAGFGDMVFQLFDDLTPNTVATIEGLVKSEFYNNLTFHRVVSNFVIQGGDPNGNGTGGPGFTFNDEFNPSAIYSGNGQLGLANSGPDTNGSQFFVTLGPQRILDFNQAIFGQLVRGFDVLSKIDAVPVDSSDKPTTPVVITSASIIQDTTDTVLMLQAVPGATGSSTITVTASDGKGGTSTQTLTVQAMTDTTDDPPILGPVSNGVTPVNTPVTINLSSTDLQNDPVQYEAIVQGTNPGATATVNGNVVTVTPNAGFTGPVQVLVGVAQQGATGRGSAQGLFDTQIITVGVGDLALSATGVGVSASEGTSANGITVATFTDPDPNAAASDFTASINWGDSHVSAGTVTLGSGGMLTVAGTNTYKEAGTYPVKVTITDRLGAVATATSTGTVTDAPLTAQAATITAAAGVAGNHLLVATFTDNDPNATAGDYTATIDWGDGTSSAGTIVAGSTISFSVTGSHTYSTQGSFTASVTITDINTAGDVAGSTAAVTSAATVSQPIATTTTLTVSPTSSTVFGQAVVLTATVSAVASGSGTPSGTVTFQDGTTTLGTGTLDANGTATFTTTSLTAGTSHSLIAVYNGGGAFTGSTSSAITFSVNKADATVTVTASPNPATAGQATTFTAILTAVVPGSGTPTGTVTFMDGTTTLGTGTLDANGQATFQTSALTQGQHTITAVYAGDSNFNTATSTPLNLTVKAAPVATDQSYVTQLYQNLLGRAPDPQGLNTFTTALSQNSMSRAQVAETIATSDEGRTHEIQNLYQTYLARAADPVGLDLSLSFLKAGGPLQQVRAVILGSPEYFQSRSGSDDTTFLTNVYHDVLGRTVDAVGQSLGGQALAAGMDRVRFAEVVLSSAEGEQDLVQNYYTQLLNRTADGVGMAASTAAMAQGASEEAILIAIAESDEFFNRT